MDDAQVHDVRCQDNPFHTLLFRYDGSGIWVYCRDCRDEEGKRGQEHLIPWGRLFRMLLGLESLEAESGD